MALPVALRGPWNPFCITGTPMPPNLLLMCKVLALALLATGHFRILPDPFLPFIPGLDQLVEPTFFRVTLQTVVVLSALALLFNRSVRATALLLGGCMLLAVVCSKAYYGNNKTFVGLALVLAGLSDFDRPPYLLRWQFALVYFGAALNKVLDPDWQSGLFFDYWGGARLKNPVYLYAAENLPDLLAGKVMCWGTIIGEFFIALGVLIPPLVPLALWVNVFFQVGLLQFTGSTFTLFFYAMQAAALAFITWPRRLDVWHLAEKPLGKRWWQLFDPDGLQQWQRLPDANREVKSPSEPEASAKLRPSLSASEGEYPSLSASEGMAFNNLFAGAQARTATPPPETNRSFLVRDGQRFYTGIAARCRLLIYSPVFWLLATATLALLTWLEMYKLLPFFSAESWRRLLVAAGLLVAVLAFWPTGRSE